MSTHRNISFAAAETFQALLSEGAAVTVRASDTKEAKATREIRNHLTVIKRPLERCLFLPGRGNNIFGQVAESMWVIGGRNDVEWLARYVPRAENYSDDGVVWRAGYGPRLRRWNGKVDQLDEWRRLILDDATTRRAAGVLFDPNQDFAPASKDVPCNNWLSWLLRDNKLHLTIGIRSNDALWGFSGANAFEWSILHQMMAFWVDAEVGDATFLATSFHFYEDRARQIQEVVERFYGVTPYDFGVYTPTFKVQWSDFADAMHHWFNVEEKIRNDPEAPLPDGPATRDPLLGSSLRLLRLKWGAKLWDDSRLQDELSRLPEDDFTAAAYDFFTRRRLRSSDCTQPKILAFFMACAEAKSPDLSELKEAIKKLHTRKNLSYAGAWKRRGERVSVLPNIARKLDRLEAIVDEAAALEGETTLDTVIDLYVYALKYQLFLADVPGAPRSLLGKDAPRPFSDHDINFNVLVDASDITRSGPSSFAEQVRALMALFEEVWQAVDADAGLSNRQRWAEELAKGAEQLLATFAKTDAPAVRKFIQQELR